MEALTLDCQSIELTDEQFYQLCNNNPELRFERNANGDLLIMPPTGGETGNKNAGINAQLWNWNNQQKLGKVFDSSTGFKLPSGANRSPDAAWILLAQWDSLTNEQKQKFLPLCPDFAVELLSPSDKLSKTQDKMQEYLDNGMKLGWLINSQNQQVEIYRQGKQVEILDRPDSLSGEAILPGFILDLEAIW
ncbi:MAG: Uma2 family endonuclease [Pleurocapsa sp. SU_5_0]|nr:Uma2 family endonuclease [Pleurocapsa sp. SU_5_0]NJO98131.1 Uma2 family endonuclease [Pleurocapsa sp. CRU_1_2]NJR46600.1 Uma2 family endonuclease [Hyellaceae cyanobacterium CSU_1_1]